MYSKIFSGDQQTPAEVGRVADVERGDADICRSQVRGHPVVRHRAGKSRRDPPLGLADASSGPRRSTRPKPAHAALVQPVERASEMDAPCQRRKAPAKTATGPDGRVNGSGPAASGWNLSVSAPHSSSRTLDDGVPGGRMRRSA